MANIFDGILDDNFKTLFNDAIDTIINQAGLAVPCKLLYSTTDSTFCSNCLYNPITNRSLDKYNGTGPINFPENSTCPICMGFGKIVYDTTEIVYMAAIFDSKYWLNWGPKFVNIPNLAAQTLCPISLLPKIENATQVVIDTNIANYGNNIYSKAGYPTPMGLGQHRYILTNWTRP